MIATLLREPFNLSLDQVARLTDRQIHHLYFHPTDADGRPKPPPRKVPDRPLTPEEERALFFGMGASLGIKPEQLQREWDLKRGQPTPGTSGSSDGQPAR